MRAVRSARASRPGCPNVTQLFAQSDVGALGDAGERVGLSKPSEGAWKSSNLGQSRGDPVSKAAGRGQIGDRTVQGIASEEERARAFVRARRHTAVVRVGKVALPLVALVAVGSYIASLSAVHRLKVAGVQVGSVKIDPKNLTMQHPKYNGFGKDGSRYTIQAREAITDLKQSGPIRLNLINGEIAQPTGTVTRLKANWGAYDQKKDVLELYEQIDVDGSSGMKARLTRATVWTKESRVSSSEPVFAETEAGTIRARQMSLNTKLRQASFSNAVHVTLNGNSQRSSTDAIQDARSKPAAALPGLSANSGLPIEVKSEQLDVDDNAKTALFRRDVIARQGDAVLQAPELDVRYEGRPLSSEGAAPGRDSRAQTRLKTVSARGGVVVINKDERAQSATLDYDAVEERVRLAGGVVLTSANERQVTARQAEFDQKSDTALLTGDVVVVQGRNTLRGQRLFVDRRSGRGRLDSLPGQGQAAQRIHTVFYQSAAQRSQAGRQLAPSDSVQQGTAALTVNFNSDPSKPIDIEADSLDIADADRKATYRGTVIARQGDFLVETPELTAFYTGQSGLASVTRTTPQTGSRSDAAQGAQLTRVEARQRVKVSGRDGQRAESENADFDVKQNRIVMWGGTVRVEQRNAANPGKSNVVVAPPGARFVIDMNSGESRFEQMENTGRAAGPAISAARPAGDALSAAKAAEEASGPKKPRMRAVIYPNEAKDAAKQKAGDLGLGRNGDKSAKERTGREKPPASSWEPSVSGSKDGKQ